MFSFQNTPFTIYKAHDVPKEALERLSFEEKYEGYVIDFMKALSEEVKFKYKFHLVGMESMEVWTPTLENGMVWYENFWTTKQM